MEKVHVPTVAYEAALELAGANSPAERGRSILAIQGAASHIVAWELEQFARKLQEELGVGNAPTEGYGAGWASALDEVISDLRGRAAELRGE